MKSFSILILYFLFFANLSSQTYTSFSLYFEDAQGRLDTLNINRVDGATDPFNREELDVALGEIDIQNQAISELDVRFFDFRDNCPNSDFEYCCWECDHVSGSVSFDTNVSGDILKYYWEIKSLFLPFNECSDRDKGRYIKFFIPFESEYPIRLSWDNSLLQDDCHQDAVLSEKPFDFIKRDFEFGLEYCPEQVNHPFVSLQNSNSVVLEQASFLNFFRADSVLVSPYYIIIPNSTSGSFLVSSNEVFQDDFRLYPNPSNGSFTIEGISSYSSLEIYNINGQRMKIMEEFNTNFQFDEKGVFILVINTDKGQIRKRIVCH